MAKTLKLSAVARDSQAEKNKQLRREGIIPAVIYGKGADAVSIKLNAKEFFKTFHGNASENILIDLSFKDKPEMDKTVIIKDFQKNPLKDEFLHIDFVEIHAGEKLSTHVPIHFKGKSPGIAMGGILEHSLRELYIECLPKDIPSDVVVDVSVLQLGDSVHVRDLKIDPAIKVLTPEDTTVVAIAVLKKAEETAEGVEEEAGAVSAGPEVIKQKAEEPAGA